MFRLEHLYLPGNGNKNPPQIAPSTPQQHCLLTSRSVHHSVERLACSLTSEGQEWWIFLTSRRAIFQSDLCLPAPDCSEAREECQMLRLLLLSSK